MPLPTSLALVIAGTLALALPARAQWSPWGGPEPPSVGAVGEGGGVLLMGSDEADEGDLFRSGDDGLTWESARAPNGGVLFVHAAADALFAGTYLSGLLRSDDGGRSWAPVGGGLAANGSFGAMAGRGDTLLVGSTFFTRGLHRSVDGGQTWAPLTGAPDHRVRAAWMDGPAMLAGTDRGGLHRSADGGGTWALVPGVPAAATIGGFVEVGDDLLVGVSVIGQAGVSGLYRSADRGASWARVPSDLPALDVDALVEHGGALVAVLDIAGAYRSADGGQTWQPVSGLPGGARARTAHSGPAGLFLGTTAGLFASPDSGVTWTPRNAGSTAIRGVDALLADGGALYVGLRTNGGGGRGLWRTADLGATWTHLTGGLPPLASVSALLRHGGTLLAAELVGQRTVHRSADGGATWAPGTGFLAGELLRDLAAHGGAVFAAGRQALYRSDDGGATWAVVPGVTNASALAEHEGALYAGRYGEGVLRSADDGTTWAEVNVGLSDSRARFVNDLLVHEGRLYLASQGAGVFRLDGATWTPVGPPTGFVYGLTSAGGVLVAATPLGDHLYASPDGGATWLPIADGYAGGAAHVVASVGDRLVAGSQSHALWALPLSQLPAPVATEPGGEAAGPGLRPPVPNPARGAVRVSYRAPRAGAVRLALYDALGRRLRVLDEGIRAAGDHAVAFDVVGLQTGAYLLRLETDGAVHTRRLTVAR